MTQKTQCLYGLKGGCHQFIKNLPKINRLMKKEKINCEKARNLCLLKVLAKLGHFPKKESEKEAWFLSPFRSETQASFKVSKSRNRWYDHGKGVGGNVIDLVSEIFNSSVQEVLEFLNDNLSFFSFQQQPIFMEEENSIRIIKVKEIMHLALIQYLRSRRIPITIARRYCKEVWYQHNKKQYFAIGLQNRLYGWELRNKFCKNSSSPKAYTHFNTSKKQLTVVEGMFDLLALVTLGTSLLNDSDIIVLNSLSFLEKIEKHLHNYTSVHLYLDNDTAGKKATDYLMNAYSHITDKSNVYKKYKDLNDFLIDGKRI